PGARVRFGGSPWLRSGGRRNTLNGGSAPPDPAGAHLQRWPAAAASAMSHAAVRHGRPPKYRHMRRTPCRGGVRLARSRPRRVHHLQLAELLDPPLAVLAAEPAPLDAAEGDLGAHVHVLVDPGRTALEALGDLLAARDVVGPHRAAEAVVRAVRLRERVVEVAIGDDGERRAELLLVDQAHALA